MAIQAELGPPVLPPLPLQPPLKPPSLAVHNINNYSIGNSNHNSNNLSSALPRQSREQSQQHNHRKNHHRQHVYQQRHPAAYSPYPSIVPYGRPRPPATTTTTALQGKPLATPRPSTPPGTGLYTTLTDTTPRTEAPLPQTQISTTPSKASQRPKQRSPRSATTPPTPTAAVAQPQQARATAARPPPPAHRRIRYHQHHVSRASARSELTLLTSGPLNNSLLQMTSQTPVLTWPQKCVLAMSKERYLASAPSIAHQVFRSYYEDRDDAVDCRGDDGETAAISGLPSPPPDQDNDCRFEFHYQNDDNDRIAMATAPAAAANPYHLQQQQNRETLAGNFDVGEISSLSSEEPPNMMDLPPTGNGNDNATAGEVSSVSSSDNPSPKPLALPVNIAAAIPERQQQHSHQHQRNPSTPRPPPTSALISQLTVGAAVFRIDVRSQRPTILLLKKRAPTAAAPATTGPASGPPSPYQQHHPQHHYNRPFLEQLPRHLLLDNDGNNSHNNDGDDATKRSSCLPPPAVWELPSGRVDDGDYCISDAIARCVKRLTTLNVVRISSMLRETTISTAAAGNSARSRRDRQNVDYDPLRALPRGAAFTSAGAGLAGGNVRFMDEEGWPDLTPTTEKMQLQLNWTVLVANVEDVVLKGVEHEEFVWANWNVLDMLNLTSATREVAKEALEWAGRCSF